MPDSVHNPAQRSEALLSWIQQFAPYGVITLDESFVVQSWNHWMESHSSLRLEDVQGKSLFTLFPDLRERLLVSHFERALRGESSVLSTALHRYLLPLPSSFRANGIPYMLQTARISPLFLEGKVCGIVLLIEDVTQRESQAETLVQQHRHDELLSWSLAQLLKTEQPRKAVRQLFFKIAEQLDFDSFLIYLRDAETGKLCLYAVGGIQIESEKDFVNCPFLRVLAQPHRTTVLNAIRNHQEDEFAALKVAGISAAVVIPLIANERDLGLLCFTTWAREHIEPEELELVDKIAQFLATALDRENTNRQLQIAKELLSEHAQLLERRVRERTARLQETVSELETFSYTVAHDLRAPVRGINGFCGVLLEDFGETLPPEVSLIIRKISNASNRMDSLTRDLLEFSKISRQEIILSKTEIEPIIEELVAIRSPAYRQAILVRAPLLPVRAHKGMLQHVFSNLVDNAIKFVSPGTEPKITIFTETVAHTSPNTRSGALTFSSAEDSFGANAEGATEKRDTVRVWVSDEGIGIAPEVHQKIFGIFERGAISEAYEGTGIGLAIVARAVQRMGGTCGVESDLGKGSRFWLELPAG